MENRYPDNIITAPPDGYLRLSSITFPIFLCPLFRRRPVIPVLGVLTTCILKLIPRLSSGRTLENGCSTLRVFLLPFSLLKIRRKCFLKKLYYKRELCGNNRQFQFWFKLSGCCGGCCCCGACGCVACCATACCPLTGIDDD